MSYELRATSYELKADWIDETKMYIPRPGVSLAVLLSCALAITAVAQTPRPAGGSPAFEVASVKKVIDNDGRVSVGFYPERFEALATVHTLIQIAYNLREFQLERAAPWIHSDYFQVIANASGNAPVPQMRLMLRGLLADRFKLSVHFERRVSDSYSLVMARTDGRMGPKLRKSEVDCAALGPYPPSAPPSSKGWCGFRGTGPRRVTGQGATLSDLAQSILSLYTGRIVMDNTGLEGGYDFELMWYPDQTATDSGPSLGSALEDQLGLKLRPTKGPIDFLVIDHAEPPTPD